MRRFFSLVLIAALLSVTSIPLLPEQARCAHAAEQLEDCDSCHDESIVTDMSAHDEMPADMDMSSMSLNLASSEVVVSHKHNKELSTAAVECRIECGCGCHRSLDGFPQVLAPHMTPHVYMDESMTVLSAVKTALPSLVPFVEPVSTPPPRLI
ncbi:MAG: hypothetical protein R8K22_07180 [Mariprofundaceae bacterium]